MRADRNQEQRCHGVGILSHPIELGVIRDLGLVAVPVEVQDVDSGCASQKEKSRSRVLPMELTSVIEPIAAGTGGKARPDAMPLREGKLPEAVPGIRNEIGRASGRNGCWSM